MSVSSQAKLAILWTIVILVILAGMGGWSWLQKWYYDKQFAEAMRRAKQANDGLVDHTKRILSQADLLLCAVRGYYLRTRSVGDTEAFIATLGFDNAFVENVYLLDADGLIVIPSQVRARGLRGTHRDYFQFHLTTAEDVIRISSVSPGQVTGKSQFRVTRRIDNPDGSFGGVVLVPVEPQAFTDYYRQLLPDPENVAMLIGTLDRRIRARNPELSGDMWQQEVPSALWRGLERAPQGTYREASFFDHIKRQYVYSRVSSLPLALVNGFSEKDVRRNVARQMEPITLAAVSFDIIVVMLALILTIIYRQREEMQRLAATDALTGVFNRRHVEAIGLNEFARSRRYKSNLSLIMLDIDHFKAINDKWGHPTGDRVIQAIAKAMGSVVRGQDVVGRVGGEEFLVILPETGRTGSETVAERIRRHVEEDVTAVAEDGTVVHFLVSLGVATLAPGDDSFIMLLSRADKALYKAKSSGRNCVMTAEAPEDAVSTQIAPAMGASGPLVVK